MTARRGWAVVVVAVMALTLVWRFLPSGSPPIYDGQCIADPYVTLSSSPPAKGVDADVPGSQLLPRAGVNTTETPPQAQILVESGTFVNSTPVTISITPVPAPAVKPTERDDPGQRLQFSAVNASGPSSNPSPSLAVFVILRGLDLGPGADDRSVQRHVMEAALHAQRRLRQHL